MNDRLVMVSNKLLNDSNLLMHDQAKMFSNEYYNESRYMDDGIIDDLMISGSEPLSELNDFNKSSNMHHQLLSCNNNGSANLMSLNGEEFYNNNQYAFNQMTNHLILNSNNGAGGNPNPNSLNGNNINAVSSSSSNPSNAYFHTLQAPHLANNYNHQLLGSNSNNGLNPSYLTVNASNSGYGIKGHHNVGILSRSPSCGNSSERGGVNSSSSSSSPSSSASHTQINQNHSSLGNSSSHFNHHNQQSSNGCLVSPTDTSPVNENGPNMDTSNNKQEFHGEYESSEKINSAITAASEHAEMIRQKQLRGCILTQEEIQLLAKDRQRKDNHNMIERRRRFNINDRIKELGQLLPKHGDHTDTKQNKGSILKASVDYILKVRLDMEEMKKIQESNKHLISLNKKLYARVKDLELLCRANGISTNQPNTINNNNCNYLIINNSNNNMKNENDSNLNIQMNQGNNFQSNNYNSNVVENPNTNNNINTYSNQMPYNYYHSNNLLDGSSMEIPPKDHIHNQELQNQIIYPCNSQQIINSLNNNNTNSSVSASASPSPSPHKKTKINHESKKMKLNTNNHSAVNHQNLKNFEKKEIIENKIHNGLKEEPISPKRDNILINNSIKQNTSPNTNTSDTKLDKKKNKQQQSTETTDDDDQELKTNQLQKEHEIQQDSSDNNITPPRSPVSEEASSLSKLLMVSSSNDPMMSSSISSPLNAKSPNNRTISGRNSSIELQLDTRHIANQNSFTK